MKIEASSLSSINCISEKIPKNLLFEKIKTISLPGGLEPPTFRLTAERANQLRHGSREI